MDEVREGAGDGAENIPAGEPGETREQAASAASGEHAAPREQAEQAERAEQAEQAEQAAAPAPRTRTPWSRRRIVVVSAASAFALVATGAGVGSAATLAVAHTFDTTNPSPSAGGATGTLPGSGARGFDGGQGLGGGQDFGGGTDGRGTQSGLGTQNGSGATTATTAQSAGVVLIDTDLEYGQGEAAGTGIVLSSDGEILTNNHVVEGSTQITVSVATTGKQYTARVVGTDATDDIAVLQLEHASGLTVASIDDDDDLGVGDAVTGVGNAEGQGYLSAAAGRVTALEQQITVNDDLSGAAKTLDGLIETDAPIVSGDSGGPLLDAEGEVVGIDTAASSNSSDPTGFAIPIDDALGVAKRIAAGSTSGDIQLGYPAFLGVELSQAATTVEGAPVAGVVDGTGAADAGLTTGDVITAVDGTAIADGTGLSSAISAHKPGDTVRISWVDTTGTSRTAPIVLTQGPAA
ncbi:trypsin-like peptidase domain-containing protein [Galbitalea sp. SE-J8]|uniref:S1C family serine protease n=1 Tax=Galbitalea sp. SE-J8 TaxID=3054952 RepID=UPI00259CEE88|nr:trypsin-like peptidase domain-containing protein [Galbitalea sp. SE-J8]MDM4763163.1 trypsin-like peptidase domain-containing protein [Galbitalea sp. SE-J8]